MLSPTIGQPLAAQCTRSWWVRPVTGVRASQVSCVFLSMPASGAPVFDHPPLQGRVGLPKAVRGGVAAPPEMTATPRMRKRRHPLPARWRGPAPDQVRDRLSLQPNLAVARVRPLYPPTEVGQARLRLGEVKTAPARAT